MAECYVPGRMALDELTSDEAIGDLLVMPLGATEQHGPHLPLGTDTIIATALASTLDAVVAPALPYGSSGEHAGFAGTLSIGREALVRVLVELVRSSTFARVLFVCAHGGNAEPLAAAVRQLRDEGHDVWAWSPRWDGDAHAGRVETSLLLALAPHLVGSAREPGNVEPLAALMPRLRTERRARRGPERHPRRPARRLGRRGPRAAGGGDRGPARVRRRARAGAARCGRRRRAARRDPHGRRRPRRDAAKWRGTARR